MNPISATLWPALSRLLDQALDLPPAERRTWLEALHREQPTLAPAVAQLLAAHAQRETGDFLDRGPALPAAAEDDDATLSEHLHAGDAIGPYRLLRPLGSGGMAVVWLAERGDGTLTRQVALKLPQRFVWRPGLAERFAREGDILARLEHAHIARLYDAGVSAADSPGAGLPYLVLEYVEGTHLTAYCDAHRLPITQRLALFMQVLDAVQYAHTRLVIHRDLKPTNILVTGAGEVRLLDFGIAKMLAGVDEPGAGGDLTQRAGRSFTPDYASPEQVLGQTLGTASDVYSLGVVLYELLCGQRPYRLRHTSAAQLEQAIVEVDPSPPSSRADEDAAAARGGSLRKLQRALRGELDTIVLKALRKRPEQRYGTVAELAEDLRRHRDGQAVLARPESRVYRLRKFVLRNRLTVGAAAVVAAALIAGSGVSLWQASVAQRQAQRAQAVQAFMTDIFRTNTDAQADPLKARQTTARELLDIGAQRIDDNLKDDPEGRAEVLLLLGDMYYALGLDAQAADLYGRRAAALKQAFGPRDRRVAQALAGYGKQLDGLGRYAEQRRVLDEAKSILDDLGDTHSEQRAVLLDALATAYAHSGQQAIAYARQAVAIYRQHYPKSEDFPVALNRLGTTLWRVDDFAGAEAAFTETLALLDGDPKASVSAQITALLTLASVQQLQQKLAAAEASYRRALDLTMQRNGPQHVDTLHTQACFGGFLHRSARRDQAWQQLNAPRATLARGDYTPSPILAVNTHLCQALLAEGRYEEARAPTDAVVGEYRQVADGKSPQLVAALRLQAEQRLGEGRVAEADQAIAEAWALLGTLPAEQQRTVVNPLVFVAARIALHHRQPGAALQALARVEARRGEEHAPLPIDPLQAQTLRGQALLQQGLAADARAAAETVVTRLRGSRLRDHYQAVEAEALLLLGRARLQEGHADTACQAFDDALRLRLASLGDAGALTAEARSARDGCRRGAPR